MYPPFYLRDHRPGSPLPFVANADKSWGRIHSFLVVVKSATNCDRKVLHAAKAPRGHEKDGHFVVLGTVWSIQVKTKANEDSTTKVSIKTLSRPKRWNILLHYKLATAIDRPLEHHQAKVELAIGCGKHYSVGPRDQGVEAILSTPCHGCGAP